MTLQATPAHSSRITKPRRRTAAAALGLTRKTSSRTSLPSQNSTTSSHDHDYDKQLPDTGLLVSLSSDLHLRDVPQYITYILRQTFSPLPAENSGMNSVRIAEVLNYRARLPPFVTIAHVDALSKSATRTEREIAELVKAGVLRRVRVEGRGGVGAASVGEGVAGVREWEELVRGNGVLGEGVKAKYISVMTANPTATSIPGTAFTSQELSDLVTTGFLTSASTSNTFSSYSSLFASLGSTSLAAVSTSGSRHAAGSLDAVGGINATQHIHSGTTLSGSRPSLAAHYTFSLPNMGTHIKLLVAARNHILALLKKTKYKEMPLHVLAERWDGGVATNDVKAERKKLRGEFAGVLPGKTKKWKVFYGMRFEWALEECVGAGLVELFETGSVGRAVRVVS